MNAGSRADRGSGAGAGSTASAVRPGLRRLRRAVAAAVGGVVLVLGAGASGAQAAEGYRYWSFWDRDGDSWVYATKGPGIERPGDGDVHGVRFGVSEESGGGPRPRGAADFEAICGDTEPGDGKRVALVLDFGTAAHAPGGQTPPPVRTECASVPGDATLGDALAAVAEPLRYDSDGLLCAIDGYPRSGCAEPASDGGEGGAGDRAGSSADADAADGAGTGEAADDGDSGPSTGTVGGIAVVAVLAGLTVWQLRRRRA
ncbi:SCO2322 family protein [Streptomyces aculeolatus]